MFPREQGWTSATEIGMEGSGPVSITGQARAGADQAGLWAQVRMAARGWLN